MSLFNEQRIIVFTDGASKGNPGPGGWGVIIVTPDGHVTELGGGSPQTTNNKMELTGAIEALSRLRATPGPLAIYTDSTYVIQGISSWVHNWRRKGWRTATGAEVLNREFWERLWDLTTGRGARSIAWHYVRGHVGTPGNERVDAIADGFSTGQPVTLYDGPLAGYGIDVMTLPDDTSVPSRPKTGGTVPARSSKAAAFSYLSLVDGRAMRHASWADCERRVKGRSGAKFKKATSPDDEAAILRSWGSDPRSL